MARTGPWSVSSPPPSPSTVAGQRLPRPSGSLTLAFFTRSMASACSSGLVPNTCRGWAGVRAQGPPKQGWAVSRGPHRAEETHPGEEERCICLSTHPVCLFLC